MSELDDKILEAIHDTDDETVTVGDESIISKVSGFISDIPTITLPDFPKLPPLPKLPPVPPIEKYITKALSGVASFADSGAMFISGAGVSFIDFTLSGVDKLTEVSDKWLKYANPPALINSTLIQSLLEKIKGATNPDELAALYGEITEFFTSQMAGITKIIEDAAPVLNLLEDLANPEAVFEVIIGAMGLTPVTTAIETLVEVPKVYVEVFDALREKIATAEFPVGFDILSKSMETGMTADELKDAVGDIAYGTLKLIPEFDTVFPT